MALATAIDFVFDPPDACANAFAIAMASFDGTPHELEIVSAYAIASAKDDSLPSTSSSGISGSSGSSGISIHGSTGSSGSSGTSLQSSPFPYTCTK